MTSENTINLDSTNCGSFCGPIASKYAYTPVLRNRVNDAFKAAQNSNNRYFVLEGEVIRAAQSTLTGAMSYMKDGFVLLAIALDHSEVILSDGTVIIQIQEDNHIRASVQPDDREMTDEQFYEYAQIIRKRAN